MHRALSAAATFAASAIVVIAGYLLIEPAQSNALPSTGSLLVPEDVVPGYYWATPTDSDGGYVEVCADYDCDVSAGMIENYSVDGRTMIVVPTYARLINVSRAQLSPAKVGQMPSSRLPAPAPESASAPSAGDTCSPLNATTQDGAGQTMWCNPLMTGDHSLHWMYGGPS